MFKKCLFIFLFIIISIGGYIAYNHYFYHDKSSKVSRESQKIISIISNATDEIAKGVPVRSERGTISRKDHAFILSFFRNYEKLLSDEIDPKKHGYTESEQQLVRYTIKLFTTYNIMNQQFILGDMSFASTIMKNLYEDLDKAPMYLYLESQGELKKEQKKQEEQITSVEKGQKKENFSENKYKIEESTKEQVSEDEIRDFMEKYADAGMKAIRENDFSYIKSFLDPKGKAYRESQKYIKYINDKNISETLLTYQVNSIKLINKAEYVVTAYEEYGITYGDGTTKIKSFNNTYKIKVLENGRLAMNELLTKH
ncbi:TcaA NTF2-like domain-containing protein [Bacillus cytotoxicus]|uniref:TcaA protein NTF2-like domain-containing protein n=1 Tax=Bacillus cytotoxicus (strain DSM 22905 / CIP 110041 / 391-98 / NVH 391-98) TaxID=315749 RepID=A7GKN0_BACCN|nr:MULTISPECIES: hypothetical protein [Bacillus cereus group]ABS20688.1 hypothetical protein Bcer98_0326 [Bacillus cytotoxicus NVH 391-98]AWC27321.1 hypothetical protein CG483_002130 [Bacillus cytotoxicus]AWC39434.1 hypothetical protein CG480_002125 [Bacillus cytotoxicus]AWC43431.1 hypothetical protein CG479_001970 [Bacillus cytotoxicus]AWC47365.1 hypothetical protein CG478_002125 [Bacillus cytotoxicus]